MAADQDEKIKELIAHYTTPKDDREKAAYKTIDVDIEELIDHSKPGFEQDALSRGYKGSGFWGKDENGEKIWVNAGLDETFGKIYSSNADHVRTLDTKEKPEEAFKGIDHLIKGIIMSMKDHKEGHRLFENYEKEVEAGIDNPQERIGKLIEVTMRALYVDEQTAQGVIMNMFSALNQGDINTYTSTSKQITDMLAQKLPEMRKGHLGQRIMSAENGTGKDYFKAKLVDKLIPYEAHPLSAKEYMKIDHNSLINKLYVEMAHKERQEAKEARTSSD